MNSHFETIRWTDGKEKRVYDISVSLSPDTPVMPGQPCFNKEFMSNIARGDRSNLSKLFLTSHTGTHIDSPNHFINDRETIDRIPFRTIVGPARVFELSAAEKIDGPDIRPLSIDPGMIALFKTRNSSLWEDIAFRKDYVYLTKEAAEVLRDFQVAAVGFDYIIPDELSNLKRPVHHVLFEKGIILIEGLNLSEVNSGDYYMISLPLKIREGDGAPARAILVEL